MKDDELLAALATLVRDDNEALKLDARWDALAAGELDAQQQQALKDDLARQLGADSHSSVEQIFEAFRPLEDDFRDRLTDSLIAQFDTHKDAPVDAAPVLAFPERKPRQRIMMALAASLVAALAVTFTFFPGDPSSGLPGFGADLRGGGTLRGADAGDAVPVFDVDDLLEIRLTPDTAVEGRLAARLYAESSAGLEALDSVAIQVSEMGAARISARIGGDIPGDSGDRALVAVIGRIDAMPPPLMVERELRASDAAKHDDWMAWRLRIRVAE